jgi:hypothetical protein
MSNEFTGAARDGDVTTVERLLADGLDPDTPNDGGGYSLPLAAENGHLDVVSLLLSAGASCDLGGKPALMCAATRGHDDVVRSLLSAGATINATDQNGQTALIWATAYGRSEVVRTLLSHGADKSVTDSFGNTAFTVARDTENDELRALLGD